MTAPAEKTDHVVENAPPATVEELMLEQTPQSGWIKHELNLSPSELHIVQLWAKRSGMTVNTWLRRALRNNLPVPLREMAQREEFPDAATVQAVVNEHRHQVSSIERRHHERQQQAQSVFSVHPVDDIPGRRELIEKIGEDQRTLMERLENAPMVRTHTCAFLRDIIPDGYTRATCKGTCASPRNAGAHCQWGGSVAKSCQFFAPRHGRRRG